MFWNRQNLKNKKWQLWVTCNKILTYCNKVLTKYCSFTISTTALTLWWTSSSLEIALLRFWRKKIQYGISQLRSASPTTVIQFEHKLTTMGMQENTKRKNICYYMETFLDWLLDTSLVELFMSSGRKDKSTSLSALDKSRTTASTTEPCSKVAPPTTYRKTMCQTGRHRCFNTIMQTEPQLRFSTMTYNDTEV